MIGTTTPANAPCPIRYDPGTGWWVYVGAADLWRRWKANRDAWRTA